MHVGDFMYSAFSLPHPNHDPAYFEAESGQLVIDRSLQSGVDISNTTLQNLHCLQLFMRADVIPFC